MKRRMWMAIAGLALAAVSGCGTAEPGIGQSHRTQPNEAARFDTMRSRAEEKSPFAGPTESPREADALDDDRDFHAEAETTSPMTHTPER